MSSLESKDISRPEVSFSEVRNVLHISFGERGARIADTWQQYNDAYWQGQLKPVPIFLPAATPYGHWIGCCTHSQGQVINIQLKYGLNEQKITNTLLHEMVHQFLVESGQKPDHNARPWCKEIMRISRDYFDVEFWAAPAQPRKFEGRSVRVQKKSDKGEESISRMAIASWPISVGIQAPMWMSHSQWLKQL